MPLTENLWQSEGESVLGVTSEWTALHSTSGTKEFSSLYTYFTSLHFTCEFSDAQRSETICFGSHSNSENPSLLLFFLAI